MVIFFFSATVFMYTQPRRLHRFNLNKVVSVFYAVVTPTLNPLIYYLRNKEVKEVLRKTLDSNCSLTNRIGMES
ncbi:unnamed protein product [Caretta caretta]